MRLAIRISAVLLVIASLALGGVRLARTRKKDGTLRTVTVKRGNIVVKVSDTGTVEPRLKVEVKSKAAGRILDVLIDEGDWVEKGQTIALVDRTELERNLRQTLADLEGSTARLAQARLQVQAAKSRYQTTLAQAQARLTAARANLKRLRVGARPQELARSESEVESVRIALADAQSTYEQRLALLNQGVLRRRQAESEVKAGKAALAQLKAGARGEEIRSAEAAVERAQATRAESERERKRQKQLYEKGFVSEQRVQSAETQVELAAADLRRAREQLSLVKAGSRQEEIDASEARLDRAEAELAAVKTTNEQEIASLKAKVELARADLARSEQALSLLKEGTRAEELESADAQVREAEAALAAAQDGQTEVLVAQEEVAQARASASRLEQTRDNVQTQLEDTTITAPISGTVIDRAIDPGELVTSGVVAFSQGQTILTLADLSEMRIEARVNEVDVAKLRFGQTVNIKVDALPAKTMKGLIRQISPSASAPRPQQDSGIVMFDVLIVIPDPDPELKTGMSADVDVLVDEAKKVLYLPLEAVWKKKGKWRARLVTNPETVKTWQKDKAKGKAPEVTTKDVTLQCGRRSDVRVEIKKGLRQGDIVRTDNLQTGEKRRKFDIKGG